MASTPTNVIPPHPLPSAIAGGTWFTELAQKMEVRLRVWPPRLLMSFFVTLVMIVGWVDYVTPWEVNLSLVYGLIILLASWVGTSGQSFWIAGFATLTAWVTNIPTHPYQTIGGHVLANVSRLCFFYCIAIATCAIRKRQELDATRLRMLEEVRQLESEIVSASEHEQQRIGQDLHDGLCQQLAAISCAARALADDLQVSARPEAADAAKIEQALSLIVQEARSMARGIFPVHVDCSGLSTALGEMAASTSRLTGVNVVVTEFSDVAVNDPEVAMHLYRIAQEAVANAVRHSGAEQVVLSLHSGSQGLELRVDDNGCGIGSKNLESSSGMGLRTMRYRARALGAEIAIQARAGGGTSVCCQLTLKQSASYPSHDQI